MPEKIRPINYVEISYKCDQLDEDGIPCEGQQLATGITQELKEEKVTRYQHRCTHCDTVKVFLKTYPVITYH